AKILTLSRTLSRAIEKDFQCYPYPEIVMAEKLFVNSAVE
ncbi:MAG: hypothetical protein ACI825_001546, partial [Planctomycetota bacterium]